MPVLSLEIQVICGPRPYQELFGLLHLLGAETRRSAKSYILVSVEVASIDTVAKIKTFTGVIDAASVYGPWDIVVHVKSSSQKELGALVRKIRKRQEVTDSISLVAIDTNDR